MKIFLFAAVLSILVPFAPEDVPVEQPIVQTVQEEENKPEPQVKAKKPEKKAIKKTEPKAPSKVTKVTYSGDCNQWKPLVSKYSWNVDIAMAIMQAESGCNPNAANWSDSHNVCMGSFGLFQISCHSGQIYDPAKNVQIAWQKYQSRGWQPWGAYTNQSYLKYLN